MSAQQILAALVIYIAVMVLVLNAFRGTDGDE